MNTLTIDPEFQALLPPLSTEAYAQLEANLLKDGCRDAIVIWNGVIVDGHNRYALCTYHKLPFETKEMDFPDREAVKDWIDATQIGRRNLTPDQNRLALGRRYNRTKKEQGGTGANQHKQSGQIDHSAPARTAATLAAEHGVSEKTVRRAGKFAEKVEADPELQQAVRERKPVNSTPQTEPPRKKFPSYTPPPSTESIKAGEEADKDSETLWLLKSTWRKATKKDKSAFLAWAQQ